MADVPHLTFPLRVISGRFACLEQDSPQDVAQCVATLLRTPYGWRDDMPDLGVDHVEFRMGGPNLQEIERQIVTYEPRAEALISDDPAALEDALAVVDVKLTNQ